LQPAQAPKEDPSQGEPSVRRRGQGSILSRAVRGAFWIILSGVGARVVGIVGTLAVTHYLSPDEYGEVSLAALVTLTASVLANCGMSQYIASKLNAGRAAVFTATFYYLLTGFVALGLAVLLSGPIGDYLNAPNIRRLLLPLAGAAVIDRLCALQDRVQIRDMRFRLVSAQRGLGELVYSVVSIALAATCTWRNPSEPPPWWAIFGGVYALVWATVARGTVRLVILAATTLWREWIEPHRITWARTREFFRFGGPMSIATLASFGAVKFDNFVFAHHFGKGGAGIYNLAYNFAEMPTALIADTVGDVLVPSFAHMESDERRREAFPLALRTLVLLVTPLGVGMAMVAPNLIKLAFPPSYHLVITMLRILALFAVPRTVIWTATAYLQVRDHPRMIMLVDTARMVGIVVLMHLFTVAAKAATHSEGTHHPRSSIPILAACASVGFVFSLSALSYMLVIRKIDGVSLKAQILPLLPPTLACLPMVLAIWGVRQALFKFGIFVAADVVGSAARVRMYAPRLLLEIVVGAVVYVPSALLIAPRASRDFLRMLRDGMRRRRGGGDDAGRASMPSSPSSPDAGAKSS
jgi:lipopolysaccharide exporter